MSYENTIGWKQNNLGNLRGDGVKWIGKTGMKNGFSVFIDKTHGVRAIFVDLLSKLKTGTNTVEKIISKYAPPTENNTKAYIDFVAKNLGKAKNAIVEQSDLEKIVKAIIKHETGYVISDYEIQKAKNLVNTAVNTVKKKNNYSLILFGIIILVIIAYYFNEK